MYVGVKSKNDPTDPQTEVFFFDSEGELRDWMSRADESSGGISSFQPQNHSLNQRGGQTQAPLDTQSPAASNEKEGYKLPEDISEEEIEARAEELRERADESSSYYVHDLEDWIAQVVSDEYERKVEPR